MKLTGENRTCPSATLSTINPTWNDAGSNLVLRGERPATNRLSHGMASHSSYWCVFVCWFSKSFVCLISNHIFIFQHYLCASFQIKITLKLECMLVSYAGSYHVIISPAVVIADFVFNCRTLEPGRPLMKKTAPGIREGKMQGFHDFAISIALLCRLHECNTFLPFTEGPWRL
jgi:hypothetical protein